MRPSLMPTGNSAVPPKRQAQTVMKVASEKVPAVQGSGKSSTLCVPDLVQRQAAITPNALAIGAGSDRPTYRELDERSNQLLEDFRLLLQRS